MASFPTLFIVALALASLVQLALGKSSYFPSIMIFYVIGVI